MKQFSQDTKFWFLFISPFFIILLGFLTATFFYQFIEGLDSTSACLLELARILYLLF